MLSQMNKKQLKTLPNIKEKHINKCWQGPSQGPLTLEDPHNAQLNIVI